MSANPLVECIVNVSEGRDQAILTAIARAIRSVPGCALLHRDTGADANRTVFTFAGAPEAVFTAAFLIYKVSAERIDMRTHRGTHPRLGAVDVCPFVPISGVEVREILALTQELAKKVSAKLGVPVYLYEMSSSTAGRRNLADIRRGEYEGLREKVRSADWKPDFGPDLNGKFGATVMGVRPFLIAWNINLAPEVPVAVAKKLAGRLRASGSGGVPGLFPGLKAIGWYIEDFGRCQISCNVVDADKVDLARVYLTAVNLAAELGARVTGSELIGLIPEKYLRRAGKAFSFSGDATDELAAAVSVLGLDDLGPFALDDRVLERVLAQRL